jgi:transcriptional regulator with XRE-family HTH domain
MAAKTLSNREVARLLGCTIPHVSRLRSGQRTPGDDVILKIYDVFKADNPGLTVEALLRTKARGPEEFANLLRKLTGKAPIHKPSREDDDD